MTLPVNFVGIGAAKCGTGSIHRYLGEHPEVFVSPIKETNFFIEDGQRSPRKRVRSMRAYERQFAAVEQETAVGEYSPQYMNHPSAATRIAATLPDANLLVSLRCPADRAFSAWAGRACSGVERRPAEVALRPGNPYVDDGFYLQRLAPYLKLFPREHIKVLVFEEFAADPAATMAGLYRFLGAEPGFEPNVSVRLGTIRIRVTHVSMRAGRRSGACSRTGSALRSRSCAGTERCFSAAWPSRPRMTPRCARGRSSCTATRSPAWRICSGATLRCGKR